MKVLSKGLFRKQVVYNILDENSQGMSLFGIWETEQQIP